MAVIKKSGVGNILSGTIDSVEYVTTRSGVTYVRSVPQICLKRELQRINYKEVQLNEM